MAALANLRTICEENLKGRYHIEVIDLQKSTQLARSDQIIAVPMLVKRLPLPLKKAVGDRSNEEKVLGGRKDRVQVGKWAGNNFLLYNT
jgi:circadian clock protein KaiB